MRHDAPPPALRLPPLAAVRGRDVRGGLPGAEGQTMDTTGQPLAEAAQAAQGRDDGRIGTADMAGRNSAVGEGEDVTLYAKKLRARAMVLRTSLPHWYLHEGHWHAVRPLWVRREDQAR